MAYTTSFAPTSTNREAQQRRFGRWRHEFNEERPHEAIGQRTPADVYRKSAVRLDDRIAADLYGPLVQTHPVSETWSVSWQAHLSKNEERRGKQPQNAEQAVQPMFQFKPQKMQMTKMGSGCKFLTKYLRNLA